MLIYLLRHGLTQENLEKRYQGRRDVPLCPQGLAQLRRADFAPKTVMITSLQRTRQTAEVLFPDAELVVADGLKEMDFGVFEGRNYREMEHDPQYRAWVETGCEGRCPGGESKAEFCQRVCTAFAALVDAALAAGEPQLVIVAHGGTQMAALERFAVPHKNYYSWCAPGGRLCAGCRRLGTPENPARGQNRAVYKGVTMLICWAVLGGFVLDAIFGDPAWLPHPVVLMGKAITALEKRLRAQFPPTPQGELCGGAVLAAVLPVGTFLITALVCRLAAALHPLAGLAVQMFWCAQALAAKGLAQESRNVYKELQKQDLPAARKAVARIVGRDTQNLTAEGVTKAAVETVAENASDGVIAPLLYMLLGGAPLALTYKAINTMDSMLGYKNQKYLYFGRAAARLDDVANYLPSRLAGLLWVAAAALTGSSARGAWKIWRRDRRNHASPNSAQTESACAGALGVQLAGPAYYFGEYYDKPTIGDALRPVEPKDILRADRMMYAESLLALGLGIALRLLVLAM